MLVLGTLVSYYRNRQELFKKHFDWASNTTKKICVATKIEDLMEELNITYIPDEWRLFIDSSNASCKAVLLSNGNEEPSIPIGHSVEIKETYEDMKTVLEAINYKDHEWVICSDLKR